MNIVVNKASIAQQILELKKKRNAIILAHYYQIDEVQEIADFIGDSLALAQAAEKTEADIIVFAGVHFMAETAKIICPEKKVLLPDLNAGCSLADSCPPDEFEAFVNGHPNHTVVSYVNTTAKIKALSDIICTSSNAYEVVNSIPEGEKIIFGPDRNLGDYIKSKTGRDMVIWNGHCHVHQRFSLEKILALKKQNPEAKVIAHPECDKPVLIISDYIGSTAALLKYTIQDGSNTYIVATESGILHQMKKENPAKNFIPAPPNDSTCACNDCQFMKMIDLNKILNSLKNDTYEINLDKDLMEKARRPIMRMLDISRNIKSK
jgi:quinolinate synthase